MSGLQEAFYIISIVYMSIMLILILALVIAVFVIRSKVINIQRQIEARVDAVTNIAAKSGEIVGKAGAKAVNKLRKLPKR
jgi:hypothetical protein